MRPTDTSGAGTSGSVRASGIIALLAATAIGLHLAFRVAGWSAVAIWGLSLYNLPLLAALVLGGVPLVLDLLFKLIRREFGSDLLAGASIITSVLLGEYLAGSFVVLMLAGGQALERFAIRRASSVLEALAKRMPAAAHRKAEDTIADVPLSAVHVGDVLVVFPHEICPADGRVVEGHGGMDESYLTGEPYRIAKAPGAAVLAGAINGATALTIRAEKQATDSRYAQIMQVMRDSEQRRPRLRRLGDQLGAYYTPLAIGLALLAWAVSGEPVRFLAVLVVATPCPLLIAIPVAIISAISLAARRGIIIKDPAVLEKMDRCRTAIFDKTGTLTYGQPHLTDVVAAPGFTQSELLTLLASLERYSKHPLSGAVLDAARQTGLPLHEATTISEAPGEGMRGTVDGRDVQITSRKKLLTLDPQAARTLPGIAAGLECVILVNGRYAATVRFRDEPRAEGASFINHLKPKHQFERVLLVSGDRESEVRYLAERVGIRDVFFNQSPEQKLDLVRTENRRADTVFLGDGVNDAPALTAATVGIAFGPNTDVTGEAAGAVILESSLAKVDEFFHISRRLRTIALQSAVGGMVLSLAGMALAAGGYLPPVAGAIVQEVIDVAAVLNALRVALPGKALVDYQNQPSPEEHATS